MFVRGAEKKMKKCGFASLAFDLLEVLESLEIVGLSHLNRSARKLRATDWLCNLSGFPKVREGFR